MDRRQGLAVLGISRWRSRSRTVADDVLPAAASALPEMARELPIAAVQSLVAAPVRQAAARRPVPPAAAPAEPARTPPPAVAIVPASDWDGLAAQVSGCTACKLCSTRTQTVFGVGLRNAPLMVIGEAPGADEDARGEPFVGRAGKLLDEMLAAVGHSRRTDVFIANVIKCRPPGNRDPEPDEVAACRPYLDEQIRQLRPRLIVALGKVAAQRLLQTDQPMSKLRGERFAYGPEQTPLMLTYHPAYLLRSPREKARVWEDLKGIERFLRSVV